MWAALAGGVGIVALVLTFGIMGRKAYKKIGELENENEILKEQLAIAAGKVRRATAARPTIDKLSAISRRLSKLRPEDN